MTKNEYEQKIKDLEHQIEILKKELEIAKLEKQISDLKKDTTQVFPAIPIGPYYEKPFNDPIYKPTPVWC